MKRTALALLVVLLVTGCGSTKKAATGPTSPPAPGPVLHGTVLVQLREVVLETSASTATPTGAANPTSPVTPTSTATPAAAVADAITPDWYARFAAFSCTDYTPERVPTSSIEIVCNKGAKLLLAPAVWEGEIAQAQALIPHNQLQWAVEYAVPSSGVGPLRDLSTNLVNNQRQAVVLVHGVVVEEAGFTSVIKDGQFQISGSLDRSAALRLAEDLTGAH